MFTLALGLVLAASTVTLPVPTLTIIISLVIPLLVGIVTKQRASSAVKAVTNAVLASVAAGVTLLIANGGTMELKPVLTTIAVAFVTSGAAYSHLWKPLGVAEYVQKLFPNSGIGNGPIDLGGNELIMLDVTAAARAGVHPDQLFADDPSLRPEGVSPLPRDVAFEANAPHGENPELHPDEERFEIEIEVEVEVGPIEVVDETEA